MYNIYGCCSDPAIPTHHLNVKVCFAHGGGAYPYLVGRMKRGYDCRPDLCATDTDLHPTKQLGSFYTDGLVHDHRALKYLVDVIGRVREASFFCSTFCLNRMFASFRFGFGRDWHTSIKSSMRLTLSKNHLLGIRHAKAFILIAYPILVLCSICKSNVKFSFF